MGILTMIMLGVLVTLLTVVLVAFAIAIFIGLALLIVGGSTAAPALVFALLVTMGKSESLVISALIFAVSYYVIKKMIQYKKVKNAIMVYLAVIASSLATNSVKMAFKFLIKRNPALILIVLLFGIMIFMLCSLLASDDENEKKGYPIITRATASVLYGSAFVDLLGSLVLLLDINVSGSFTVVSYVLWAVSSVAVYVLDIKLSENGENIRIIKELPVGKICKNYYDRYAKFILSRFAKFKKTS